MRTEMNTEMRELTDNELDAVSGGFDCASARRACRSRDISRFGRVRLGKYTNLCEWDNGRDYAARELTDNELDAVAGGLLLGALPPGALVELRNGIVAGATWLASKIPEWFPSLRC